MPESRKAINPKWIRVKKGDAKRKEDYHRLKAAGFPTRLCRRARDWTRGHINLLIKSYENEPKTLEALKAKYGL